MILNPSVNPKLVGTRWELQKGQRCPTYSDEYCRHLLIFNKVDAIFSMDHPTTKVRTAYTYDDQLDFKGNGDEGGRLILKNGTLTVQFNATMETVVYIRENENEDRRFLFGLVFVAAILIFLIYLNN